MLLRGKTVLITGAARRIGREIALLLASRGARIVLHYNRSAKDAAALEKAIHLKGGEAVRVQADLSKTPAFIKKLKRLAPKIDVLINNASIYYATPLEKIREKDWDDFMNVNLKSPFFLSREIGLGMKKRGGGKIINLVDWVGAKPLPEYLPYAVSKAGLAAVTSGLARALAPEVQVAGVAPGPILPPQGAGKAAISKAAERTLLKRFGTPGDIARTVLFLIEGTDYVTGTIIYVEGGASIV